MSDREPINRVSGFQDLTGQSFGRLTAIRRVERPEGRSGRAALWLCNCVCGQAKIVAANHLKHGHTRSCGCICRDTKPKPPKKPRRTRFIDLTGKAFGRLTPIECVRRGTRGKQTLWRCICSCGKEVSVASPRLRAGLAKSCGCLKVERWLSHGLSYTPEYSIWNGMLKRCRKGYKALRIRVCEGWRNSFESFLADMGQRPSDAMSIDRKDTNGHYSCGHCDECKANGWPENCRWATVLEQVLNRNVTVFIERFGKRLCLKEWSRIENINYATLRHRLSRGWDIERALTEPARHKATSHPTE